MSGQVSKSLLKGYARQSFCNVISGPNHRALLALNVNFADQFAHSVLPLNGPEAAR